MMTTFSYLVNYFFNQSIFDTHQPCTYRIKMHTVQIKHPDVSF